MEMVWYLREPACHIRVLSRFLRLRSRAVEITLAHPLSSRSRSAAGHKKRRKSPSLDAASSSSRLCGSVEPSPLIDQRTEETHSNAYPCGTCTCASSWPSRCGSSWRFLLLRAMGKAYHTPFVLSSLPTVFRLFFGRGIVADVNSAFLLQSPTHFATIEAEFP